MSHGFSSEAFFAPLMMKTSSRLGHLTELG
jgi:hypothetical protein